ncbi:Protein natd1 [Mactra antiquata]
MSSITRSTSKLLKLSAASKFLGTFHPHILRRAVTMSTQFDLSKLKVEHSVERNEFYIQLKDGEDEASKAYLSYTYIKPDYVDLEHTVVPSEFRGHGIAKILAQTVFDHFVDKGTFMKPTCTYLQKFYKENQLPKYTEKIKLGNIKL